MLPELRLSRPLDHVTAIHDVVALMPSLDLVIAADTAIAHIAGALAKTTWTLLPFAPDWPWTLAGDSSPWYPTMRLFRQSAPGNWATPMEQVRMALEAWPSEPK